jgi:hypothetical protein
MIFRIFEASEKEAGHALAEGEFPHTSAALDWAQAWLRQSGSEARYSISNAEGSFSAALVLTESGQWYAIGQ